MLSKDLQIDIEGKEINSAESGYVWLDDSHMHDALLLSSDIMLSCHSPVQLVVRLLRCCKHNALSSLLTVSGVLMAFHYETIVSLWGECPITVGFGPSETGKSTAIKLGLAMVGMDETAKYVSGSAAFFLERSALAIWNRCPPEPNSIKPSDVIVSIYNGAKTANMKRNLTPRSCPVFASN